MTWQRRQDVRSRRTIEGMLHFAPGTARPANMLPIYQTVVWFDIHRCARPRLTVNGDMARQAVRSSGFHCSLL
ncbi:hypothetical protein NXC24_PB00224 (plasmid) [Rhizobium sp. NXC24]|nr:hypothetical protein NXC24_PB00224 [Rhizobium sp. NXC24]